MIAFMRCKLFAGLVMPKSMHLPATTFRRQQCISENRHSPSSNILAVELGSAVLPYIVVGNDV